MLVELEQYVGATFAPDPEGSPFSARSCPSSPGVGGIASDVLSRDADLSASYLGQPVLQRYRWCVVSDRLRHATKVFCSRSSKRRSRVGRVERGRIESAVGRGLCRSGWFRAQAHRLAPGPVLATVGSEGMGGSNRYMRSRMGCARVGMLRPLQSRWYGTARCG